MKLAALLLLYAALPAAACSLPAPAMQAGSVQAAWTVDSAPITVGRHFAIHVRLCPANAMLTRVDASMLEHRHGMNYRPSVKPLGDGRWQVDGLMFHMPGRWALQFGVQVTDGSERLLDTIVLP